MKLKLGELCAGYGGLGMAVEDVFNADAAWFSEFEEAPSKILKYHWPHVPNHGDMTKIDWAAIEPVDIISGGTPCQDLSAAGRRAGMTEGTRSNLWVQMREAIAVQRPQYVVWENVRGAYSAEADSSLEQCPGCMGDAADRGTVLRALGRVLGDLSDLGYDCQWRGLRASDVGACHSRFRVFVLARDATCDHERDDALTGSSRKRRTQQQAGGPGGVAQDADFSACGERRIAAPGQEESGGTWADAGGRDRAPAAYGDRQGLEVRRHSQILPGEVGEDGSASLRDQELAADPESIRRGERRAESARKFWRLAASRHRSSASDPDGGDDAGRLGDTQWSQERGKATAGRGEGPSTTPDTLRIGSGGWAAEPGPAWGNNAPLGSDTRGTKWGDYEPAIRRWEARLGRPAPRPTEPTGRDGGERLSPRFTEWMMGLPDGWVTDPEIGISRNEQLKACGNGVVPQQAMAALQDMLAAFQRMHALDAA